MKKTKTCPTCGHEHEIEVCDDCRGYCGRLVSTGRLRWPGDNELGWRWEFCRACNGTGITKGRRVTR